jgi:curved DNA-binding protein CbpA
MEPISTHYATLGVTQTAEASVIRAAYKALALSHHPDKTVHLSAEDRAARSALFRDIQEAFDVLGNPALKIAYDRELERHGNVDASRSTFHRPRTSSTTSRRCNVIRVTTPQEKRALKAKIEQDLAYLREQRAKRDLEDAQMDVAGLKFMLQTWVEMVQEYDDDALGHGNLRAHCAVQIQVYLAKIEKREREHEEWLEDMSRPKTPAMKSARPPPSRSATPNSYKLRTTTPMPKPAPYASSAPYALRTASPLSKPEGTTPTAYNLRTATPLPQPVLSTTSNNPNATAPSAPPTRAQEKARKEAIKQAQLDAKAAAVRAEKAKLNAKREEQSRHEAARKTHARAKAGAAAAGQRGAGVHAHANHTSSESQTTRQGSSATRQTDIKPCATCGGHHASFAEFRKCIRERVEQAEDESFFTAV